ncbi:GXLT1 xylosyltransferase, partial [Polypterus senegalus]
MLMAIRLDWPLPGRNHHYQKYAWTGPLLLENITTRSFTIFKPKRQPKPSSDEGYWDCSVCTFRNSAEAFKCMMCDVRKGTSTRKPRPVSQLVSQQVTQQFAPPTQPKKEKKDKAEKEKSEKETALKKNSHKKTRCMNLSVSFWNPYWRLPSGVCGLNCFWESAFRFIIRRPNSSDSVKELAEAMHLAVVACGDRLEETMTMIKSAVIFSIKFLEFHIFAEHELHLKFQETIILKDVDSLLYVDTDILFLQPVDEIWSFLKEFNSTQIAAMAPEHEEPRIGWYNRFARHPYYGKTGINSGVMLMNMTRIREKYFKVWRPPDPGFGHALIPGSRLVFHPAARTHTLGNPPSNLPTPNAYPALSGQSPFTSHSHYSIIQRE